MHGILKWNMKKTIQELNEVLLDTFAACGDVNRNVMCKPILINLRFMLKSMNGRKS